MRFRLIIQSGEVRVQRQLKPPPAHSTLPHSPVLWVDPTPENCM